MAGQTSIDTHPVQAPEGKTSRNRGTDHRHSLYSRSTKASDRHLCRQVESKKRLLTVGRRGYRSSTRVGSVAPLGNTKEDDYYRNDSLKYCRHEEKKKKKNRNGGRRALNLYPSPVASARMQICTRSHRPFSPPCKNPGIKWDRMDRKPFCRLRPPKFLALEKSFPIFAHDNAQYGII
ncbi:uncharacterized protein PODANS_6_11800 [Podospora anserina S mat+]|uniref:Podospora anserina S mat+ genomic DNA chromosome 6, supercontig 1 n=1 Tax=Podospora anserina (strain S / ATCC MYA-4624 / DSM 980 / FGSC 10383) TaxID=515849 RepID=B2AT03_PODAN|nr:uncharacterized protein PODANS_6_11800 [Podospora anserina S mat+]CAP67526.1 unnamed protein product [Podospora anserina S mat+]CDP30389.1 Putative protein of unknown function [Podospora anserina S mat+]